MRAIGEVTETGELRAYFDGDLVGAIPAAHLTDEAPRYDVPQAAAASGRARSGSGRGRRRRTPCSSSSPRRTSAAAPGSSAATTSSSARGRFAGPGLDAAVLRLRPSYRGLAVSLDGSGRIARLDPHTGGALAVLEAARNVACAGGEPLAVTDCLNFGNPEKPEIAWELAEAIEGMSAACEALGIPVVSGQRLALQRHGRPLDPPHAGRRLRRPRRRRPRRCRAPGMRATRSTSPASRSSRSTAPSTRRLYGELAGRPARLDLARRPSSIRTLAHDRAALLVRPRRLRGRPRDRARRGRDRQRHRRRARPVRRRADALRRRRRPRAPRLERGAPVPAHRVPSAAATLLGVPDRAPAAGLGGGVTT